MTNRPYDPNSFQQVKEALAWAYRAGYAHAETAAQELAERLGETLTKKSLGSYGDALEWTPGRRA